MQKFEGLNIAGDRLDHEIAYGYQFNGSLSVTPICAGQHVPGCANQFESGVHYQKH